MKYFRSFDFSLYSNGDAARLIRQLFNFVKENEKLFDYSTYHAMNAELMQITRNMWSEGVVMLLTQGYKDHVRKTYNKVRMILLLRTLEPKMSLRDAKQAIDPLYEIHRVG